MRSSFSIGITSFAILVVPIRTAAAVGAELFDLAAFRLRKGFSAIQTVRSVFHAGVSANVGFDRVDRYAQFIGDGRGAVSVPIHPLYFTAFKVIHHSGFLAFDSFHSRTGSRISGVRFRSSGRSDRSFYRRANTLYYGYGEEIYSKRDIAQHLGIAQKHVDKFLMEVSRWNS